MPIHVWTLGDLAWLKELALSGLTESEIAQEMTESRSEIRSAMAVMGLSVKEVASSQWCDLCGSWRTQFDKKTGWCRLCTDRLKLEAQMQSDDEEERRLLEGLLKEANRIKKQRQRMREHYGANPRKSREKGMEPSAATGGSIEEEEEDPRRILDLHATEGVTPA